ncbi:unnamed protein product [Peronospora destructor]|uniref:PCI domain-containing protein n=1 Tax=Peronospora destructor TaxID=86335 RepID=A0AAV0TFN7_9STRA|nr:unnamed protein product [Peronospora destructor]
MASDLVAYVSKLLPDATLPDLSLDIKKKDFSSVLASVFPQLRQLLALDAETDVEGAFSLLFDVVLQVPKPESEFLSILQVVQDERNASPVLRLRVIATLFNKAKMLPQVQLQALLNLLTLALSSDNDQSTNVLDQSEDKLKVLIVLEKYLATYATGQVDKEQALRASKIVLQNPVASFLARVDLAGLAVVEASLKGNPILELLEIVSTKTLKEFAAFQKSAGCVFTENGLQEAKLVDTMRLFTLCSLPTGFKEISYTDVATALDVKEENVEEWVVRAITAGLMNAKIDQLARTVTISSSLQRCFGIEQWKEMDAKLQLYKKNVGGLLNIISNARRAQEQQ